MFLIVGAYGGIGSEAARLLESSGSRVAVAGRDRERLDALDVRAEGGRHAFDAADCDATEEAMRRIADEYGVLDGVVNCAGSVLLKPAHLTRAEEWRDTLAANLDTAFAVTRGAARVMNGGGSVVLFSSAAARTGLANHEAIAAAKAGVVGLARSAAATYARKNLRFNVIAPGLVRTPLTERITSNAAGLRTSEAMHPLGRVGDPADVARLIVWLLDRENDWITGQVFGVDGGLGTVRAQPLRGNDGTA